MPERDIREERSDQNAESADTNRGRGFLAGGGDLQRRVLAMQRTHGNAAVGRMLQRWINYRSQSQHFAFAGKTKEEKFGEIVGRLVEEYGAVHEDTIRAELEKMRDSKSVEWTLHQIWLGYRDLNLSRPVTPLRVAAPGVGPTVSNSNDRDDRVQGLKDFAFTQKTTLSARVFTRGGVIPFMKQSNTKAKKHAEEVLMDDLDEINESNADYSDFLTENPRIVISLNNSPCDGKCAARLARWAEDHDLDRITIYYSNPYGSTAEFMSALTKLRAGRRIRVYSFDPLEMSGAETDRELKQTSRRRTFGKKTSPYKRLETIAKRRAEYREIPGYHSGSEREDEEGEQEVEARVTRRRRRRRGATGHKRSRSGQTKEVDEDETTQAPASASRTRSSKRRRVEKEDELGATEADDELEQADEEAEPEAPVATARKRRRKRRPTGRR